VDAPVILAILALVVAVDTVATLVLVALSLRDRRTGRGATAGEPGAAPPPRPAAATTDRPPANVPSPAPGPTASSDPLAGAIAAFLERREGLFRAPGPTAVPPGGALSAGSAEPASGGHPADEGLPGGGVPGEDVPPAPVAPLARPVAVRPARLVPAGPPHQTVGAPTPVGTDAEGGADREAGAGSRASAASDIGGPARLVAVPVTYGPVPRAPGRPAAPAPPPTPRYRPASELRVTLAARTGSPSPAGRVAVDRLAPVIGGLLRERTRARDRVTDAGLGAFVVLLPETSGDGAAALGRRLARTCDAWLAAESPPLRLDLAAGDVPGGSAEMPPEPARVGRPERRRSPDPAG